MTQTSFLGLLESFTILLAIHARDRKELKNTELHRNSQMVARPINLPAILIAATLTVTSGYAHAAGSLDRGHDKNGIGQPREVIWTFTVTRNQNLPTMTPATPVTAKAE
jgi:hypothetical protein